MGTYHVLCPFLESTYQQNTHVLRCREIATPKLQGVMAAGNIAKACLRTQAHINESLMGTAHKGSAGQV